jgi:hypothetical protein
MLSCVPPCTHAARLPLAVCSFYFSVSYVGVGEFPPQDEKYRNMGWEGLFAAQLSKRVDSANADLPKWFCKENSKTKPAGGYNTPQLRASKRYIEKSELFPGSRTRTLPHTPSPLISACCLKS